MDKNKKVFLSYAHEDRDFAEKIANELTKKGVKVWWDVWEIDAGDSIIQKIFDEGLSECSIFLILLSCASVESKWVREELDSAMIRRMEGETRVIPLVKEECRIPLPLRALRWVDLSKDFDSGIREIVKTIHGVSERPPTGEIPSYIRELKSSVGGLSKIASTIGSILIRDSDEQLSSEKAYDGERIRQLISDLSVGEINDAVEELGEFGLLRITRFMGTTPYTFGYIEPTYALFLHFKDEGLGYDPLEDIKAVASAVASKKQVSGKELADIGFQGLRVKRAVVYLEDHGIVRAIRELGRSGFVAVLSTSRTRRFVEENCR